jgi:hypothetical protein
MPPSRTPEPFKGWMPWAIAPEAELRAARRAVESAGFELAARARALRVLGASGRPAGDGEVMRAISAYREAVDRACSAQERLRRLRSAGRARAKTHPRAGAEFDRPWRVQATISADPEGRITEERHRTRGTR